jgi:CheY-like chemotaxis protein
MSPSALSRLFVAFQQADDSVAATHGGTGLGLTISRDLASLMHGQISVTSELGLGTSFTLSIPAKVASITATMAKPEPDSKQSEMPAAQASNSQKALRGTVLVAEDADDLRALAVIYLKRLGLTVIEATNGQDAVDLAMRDNPSAILMDLEMPVLHGLEAVKKLRSLGFSRPILAMTAHTGEPHRTQALAAGCNDIISKPVSYSVLRSTLDGALDARANLSPN